MKNRSPDCILAIIFRDVNIGSQPDSIVQFGSSGKTSWEPLLQAVLLNVYAGTVDNYFCLKLLSGINIWIHVNCKVMVSNIKNKARIHNMSNLFLYSHQGLHLWLWDHNIQDYMDGGGGVEHDPRSGILLWETLWIQAQDTSINLENFPCKYGRLNSRLVFNKEDVLS